MTFPTVFPVHVFFCGRKALLREARPGQRAETPPDPRAQVLGRFRTILPPCISPVALFCVFPIMVQRSVAGPLRYAGP
jgi:hypothetical protein